MLKTKKIIFIILFLFIGILSIVLFFKYQFNKNRANNNHEKFNVILIVIDALRADHLGCYGYKRDTSPNIDKFAKEGVLFSRAFSHGPQTLISIPSIFTSLYPGVHKVFVEGASLTDKIITLPEILRKRGYNTAAFVGPQLESISNFSQRFELYLIKKLDKTPPFMFISHWLNDKTIHWLRTKPSPFFLYLHYFDVHAPYNPVPPYDKIFYPEPIDAGTKSFIHNLIWESNEESIADKKKLTNPHCFNYLISQYDGKIKYVDKQVGALLRALEKSGLSKNTLVILTADHGEEFLEHGWLFHGKRLYDELTHVPLIMRLPGIIPQDKVIPDLVRHIDLVPTILDIVNIQSNNIMQGISLLPLIREKDVPKLDSFSEVYFKDRRHLKGIRTDKWKFIEVYNVITNKYSYELYDLENDPRELNNLVEEKPKEVSLFKEKLRDYTFSCQKIRSSILGKDFIDKPVILDEETKERLRSLGYVK